MSDLGFTAELAWLLPLPMKDCLLEGVCWFMEFETCVPLRCMEFLFWDVFVCFGGLLMRDTGKGVFALLLKAGLR